MTTPIQRPLRIPSRSARQQAERKTLWNDARTADLADFYTISYAGRTAPGIVELAKSVGVNSIVDIRFNPISMYKPELSKGNFRRVVESANLSYLHVPTLGVPRDIRAKAIATGDRQTIWDWYDKYVMKPFRQNLHWFFNVAEHPLAFMCLENDPSECHRHRLFIALEEHGLRGFDL